MSQLPKPPTISVPAAGLILGIPRSSAYLMARRGQLPILPKGVNGKLVVLARLEDMIGRKITRQELIRAGAMDE